MSTLKTNNIEHLDASTPSIQTTIGGGTILAGVTTVSDALSVGTGASISSPATNTLALGTNDVERLRVTSAGLVGIGTNIPGTKLDVQGGNWANGDIVVGELGNAGKILFRRGADGSAAAYLGYDGATNNNQVALAVNTGDGTILFKTNSTERLRITSGGDVGIGTNAPLQTTSGRTVLNINGTNNALLNFSYGATLSGFLYGANDEFRMEANGTIPLVFRTAGGTALTIDTNAKLILPTGSPGIQFGTTDSGGSVTSQTLDDYEEGTWTPVLAGSTAAGTMTGNSYGIYTKIGRQVSIGVRIENVTFSGATGEIKIIGLPFNASGSQAYSVSGTMMLYNISFSTDRIQAFYHSTSGNEIFGLQSVNGGAWVSWDASNFLGSTKYIQFSMTYQTT